MKKKILGIPLYQSLIVLVLGIIATGVSTTLDLQISQKFAKVGNAFGIAFALLGKFPAYALLGASGILFYIYRHEEKDSLSQILSWAGLIILPLAAGALYGYDDISEYVTSKVISI